VAGPPGVGDPGFVAGRRPRPAHHGRAERNRGRYIGRRRARGRRGPHPRGLAGHPPDGDEHFRFLRVRRRPRRHVHREGDDARLQDPRGDGHRAAGRRQPDGAHDRARAGHGGRDRLGERGGGADAPQLGREGGNADRRRDPDDARGRHQRGRGPAGPPRHDSPHAGQRHQPALVHRRGLRHQRQRRVPAGRVQQPERGRELHPQRGPDQHPGPDHRRGLGQRPRVQLRDLGEPEHGVRAGAEGAAVELRGRARQGTGRAVVREQAGRAGLPWFRLRPDPRLPPQFERVVREQGGDGAGQGPLRLSRVHVERPPSRAGHGLQPEPRPGLLLPRLRVLPAAFRRGLGALVGPDGGDAERRLQPGGGPGPDRRLRQHRPERLPGRHRSARGVGPGGQGAPRPLPAAERRTGAVGRLQLRQGLPAGPERLAGPRPRGREPLRSDQALCPVQRPAGAATLLGVDLATLGTQPGRLSLPRARRQPLRLGHRGSHPRLRPVPDQRDTLRAHLHRLPEHPRQPGRRNSPGGRVPLRRRLRGERRSRSLGVRQLGQRRAGLRHHRRLRPGALRHEVAVEHPAERDQGVGEPHPESGRLLGTRRQRAAGRTFSSGT
jgi:hypothetical protein